MATFSTWTAHPSAGSVAMKVEATSRVGVASGSDTGFDVGHVRHGGLALERCLRHPGALAASIAELPAWIDERFPYDGGDELVGRESPSIDLVIAEVRDHEVEVAWVGAGQAWHVRAGRVIAETARHTIRNAHALDAAALPSAVLDIPSRLVTRDGADPDVTRWAIAPGDRVLLISSCLLRRCPPDRLRSLAPGALTAEQIGARVERAFRSSEPFAGALMLGALVVVDP